MSFDLHSSKIIKNYKTSKNNKNRTVIQTVLFKIFI